MVRLIFKWFLQVGLPISLAGLLSVGTLVYEKKAEAAASSFAALDLFTKVLHLVQTSYVEEVDTGKLIEGALKGMLAALDPHSQYMAQEQFQEMQVDTAGKFGGLGVEISIQDGIPTVITPIDDTPAFKAGIQPGDKIVSIEDKGKKIKKEGRNLSMQDIVSVMRGEKGSPVILTVARKGLERELVF